MSDLILVIDDDPDVRTVVDITLRLAGFDVATAPDGETGFEEALKQRPDLILLDLMMPRMDGYEVCRRLRSDPLTGLPGNVRIEQELSRRVDIDEPLAVRYDPEDREAGYIEVEDRQGELRRVPPISVSIGIVTNEERSFEGHRQVVEIATEMKSFAKRSSGDRSNYASDRRTGE